jgi:hypothetical protein
MNDLVLQKTIKPIFSTIIFIFALSSASAIAGEIYGRVAHNGSIFANAKVKIKCVDFNEVATTNSNGAYRSSGPSGESKCSIKVNDSTNSITVYTSNSRTRVNLEVKGNHLFRR